MSALGPEPRVPLSGSGQPIDTSRLRHRPVQTSIEAGFAFNLREEPPFELPARLFEQLPFAVYICDRDGLVLRYNRRAAELWGRAPKLRDPDERYCGSYRMFRPDGSPLAHHQCPMADVLRTGVPVREQEVHIERPDGSLGIALVDIEPVTDDDGNIVGAVNCFQDITERKRSEAQIADLAREAEHRVKNVLATVLATVQLSQSDTADGLKHAIQGRILALANVQRLFVESRWSGAELRSVVLHELSPYCRDGELRGLINGPKLTLEPNPAQTIAVTLHELATNAAKYGAFSGSEGRVLVEWLRGKDGRLVLRWTETDGPPVKPPDRQGFGTRVMENMIRQTNGDIRFDWRAEGLVCEIAIPT